MIVIGFLKAGNPVDPIISILFCAIIIIGGLYVSITSFLETYRSPNFIECSKQGIFLNFENAIRPAKLVEWRYIYELTKKREWLEEDGIILYYSSPEDSWVSKRTFCIPSSNGEEQLNELWKLAISSKRWNNMTDEELSSHLESK